MLVYYFVPFIVSNHYLLFWVSNGHNSITVQNRTHVYMNFFHHKDLGNHLLQSCPKVVKHPVYGRHFMFIPFIPLACAECDDSLLFSGASSIPLCYVPFPATLLCQLFFLPPSLHLAICFLVYLSILLFPNLCIILFWEFCFLLFPWAWLQPS